MAMEIDEATVRRGLAGWLEAASDHPLRFLSPLRWQRDATEAPEDARAEATPPRPEAERRSDTRSPS